MQLRAAAAEGLAGFSVRACVYEWVQVVPSQLLGRLRGLLCPGVQPLSPLQEVPDSPAAAAAALLEEEQQQRGGMFSRLLSQVRCIGNGAAGAAELPFQCA